MWTLWRCTALLFPYNFTAQQKRRSTELQKRSVSQPHWCASKTLKTCHDYHFSQRGAFVKITCNMFGFETTVHKWEDHICGVLLPTIVSVSLYWWLYIYIYIYIYTKLYLTHFVKHYIYRYLLCRLNCAELKRVGVM